MIALADDRLAGHDPTAPGFMQNPWDFYRDMRAAVPVYREPRSGIYFVASYELVEYVLKNSSMFSSKVDRVAMRPNGLPPGALAIKESGWPPALTLSHNDTSSHANFRALVAPHFAPSKIRAKEPFVRERCEALIDRIEAAGTCEFVRDFAVPLPVSVISRHLGLVCFDDSRLKAWSDAIADEIGFMTDDGRAIEIARLGVEWQHELIGLARRRRKDPQDDVVSALARASIDGEPLSEAELVSLMTQLLVAGNETTTNTLATGMLHLATDSVLAATLRAEPALIPLFVEETLRLASSVQGQFRVAVADTELGGVTVPAGALLHVRLASANRDEAVFGDQPDAALLERRRKSHLAFGAGIHFCVGAQLSRLELTVAFERLLARFSRIELAANADELQYAAHFHLRGLARLPLRLCAH